ncbi:MAG: hypothetical protein E3J73_06935 [Candidatus Bathyarchaeum sp.]|nr:MAG: hypothetical protein E3J73_06935 [Candidatus Bathyarchaeum sp.]
MTDLWKGIVDLLTQYINEHNATVARQLATAMDQLLKSSSVEEFKQTGVTIRDAWIEYSQSIFSCEFRASGVSEISLSDAKKMIKYSLENAKGNTEDLIKMSHAAYDLCNKLQHDMNATFDMALQCISSSALCMGLIHLTMLHSELLVQRPYYKCPNCGSLKLETREHWEPDVDGAFKVNKLTCAECGWFYIEEMGGMSGVEG